MPCHLLGQGRLPGSIGSVSSTCHDMPSSWSRTIPGIHGLRIFLWPCHATFLVEVDSRDPTTLHLSQATSCHLVDRGRLPGSISFASFTCSITPLGWSSSTSRNHRLYIFNFYRNFFLQLSLHHHFITDDQQILGHSLTARRTCKLPLLPKGCFDDILVSIDAYKLTVIRSHHRSTFPFLAAVPFRTKTACQQWPRLTELHRLITNSKCNFRSVSLRKIIPSLPALMLLFCQERYKLTETRCTRGNGPIARTTRVSANSLYVSFRSLSPYVMETNITLAPIRE